MSPTRPSGGCTILLTGLSGAGKSTLALALEGRLTSSGHLAYVLDGDVLRTGLSRDLGFSAADRSEHLRRVGHVACVLADAGLIALLALIAPLAADRARMRQLHEDAGLRFLEVFVDTPLDECERRDPKGLYARARRGELRDFTGVSAPYEAPEDPDIVVHPGEHSVEEAAALVLERLQPQEA